MPPCIGPHGSLRHLTRPFLVESYAIETGTWDGLDEFVELVALDLDERIAVVDDFGRTIADSDPGLALPAQPIARVEPEPFLVEDVALDQAVAACELLANVQDVVTELDFDDCVEEVLDEAGLGEVGGALVYLGDDSRNDASLLGSDGSDGRLFAVALVVVALAVVLAAAVSWPLLAQDGLMDADDGWYESVLDEVGQLRHLVDDLQTLTPADSDRLVLDRQPIDVADLARDVARSHGARATAAGIAVDVIGAGDAELDERRMRQVLGNLLDNALRHTPAGGSVRIAIETSATALTIAVADTGDGIPADVVAGDLSSGCRRRRTRAHR